MEGPIIGMQRVLEQHSPEWFLRIHRKRGWWVSPGAGDDILGIARTVLSIVPLHLGILRSAPDSRTTLATALRGPGTLLRLFPR